MITTKLEEETKKPISYPVIARRLNVRNHPNLENLIVLFSSSYKGTVLSCNPEAAFIVGAVDTFSDVFNADNWEILPNSTTVTLNNNQ